MKWKIMLNQKFRKLSKKIMKFMRKNLLINKLK